MYLSRLILNHRSRYVRRDINNPYEMHRTITSAFPDKTDGGCGRILWRVDYNKRENCYVLYVQSEKCPDWSKIIKKNNYGDYLDDTCESNPAGPRKIDNKFHFTRGKLLSFCLQANPTKKIRTLTKAEQLVRKKNNGKRVALQKTEDQLEWLKQKGKKGGFILKHTTITQQRKITINQRNIKHKITLYSVRFEGILQVTDPDRFYKTLCQGIGPAKGLGMGLLSIAPVI